MATFCISTSCASLKRKRSEDDLGPINARPTKTFKDLPTELQQNIISCVLEPCIYQTLSLENVAIVPDAVFSFLDPDDYVHRLKGTPVGINFLALHARRSELMSYPYKALQAGIER